MSATNKLTETARRDLEPVNPKLSHQFEQFVDLLARRLSPAHAHLFAEPVPVAATGYGRPALAWFSAIDGEARPVAQLTTEEAETLRRTATRLISEIMSFSRDLEREGEASRDLARLLRDAIVVPDAEHLWSVDGQPVLVGWGHRRAGTDGPAVDRAGAITASRTSIDTAPAARVASSSEPRAPADRSASRQPLPPRAPARRDGLAPVMWLVFALLCGVLADRLLQACAIGGADWPSWLRASLPDRCPVPAAALDPEAAAVLAAIRSVDGEVRAAEIALTRQALTCDARCPGVLPRRAEIETPRAPPTVMPRDIEQRLEGIERGRGLELTLTWDGAADLDLQVVCPDRSRINFEQRTACGGRLVADQNRGGGTDTSRPVEHVIWDEPNQGRYAVEVSLYARHGETRPEIPFQIVLSRGGDVLEQRTGRASVQRTAQGVLTFEMPNPATAGGPSVP